MREARVAPHAQLVRADLVCMLCNRTAGSVRGPAHHFHAIRVVGAVTPATGPTTAIGRLCCSHCGGRLLLENVEAFVPARPRLAGEDGRPWRGRPKRSREDSIAASAS